MQSLFELEPSSGIQSDAEELDSGGGQSDAEELGSAGGQNDVEDFGSAGVQNSNDEYDTNKLTNTFEFILVSVGLVGLIVAALIAYKGSEGLRAR